MLVARGVKPIAQGGLYMLKTSSRLVKIFFLSICLVFAGVAVQAHAAPTQLLVGQTFVNAFPTGFCIGM
jgi:hypothetical protein